MKKSLAMGIAALLAAGLLAGCGSGSAPSKAGSAPETKASEAVSEELPSEETASAEAGASEAKRPSGLKIGCAIQTMSNQVWAQHMEAITAAAKADGNEVTVVDCQENANTQISQLENFITSGMDVIIVQPVDPEAIEEVCGQALEAGVEVLCWDEKMTNSSLNWVIRNYDLGVEIGTQAADFINEKFGEEGCEVVVLGYPQTPILLERENGILEALKEKAPKAQVVANQPAIDTTEGLNAMETILQAHPEVKVVCCIGGGGAAGANEALKGAYGTEVPDDVGIFSTDLTDEAVAAMENGEFQRCVVAITGNAVACGEEVYDLAMRHAAGEQMEHEVYRELIPVTPVNLAEMMN